MIAGASAAAVLGVSVVPQLADTLRSFDVLSVSPSQSGAITETNIGNLISQLSVFETFALWPIDDFRFQPHGLLRDVMVLLAILVAVHGALWWASRRDFACPPPRSPWSRSSLRSVSVNRRTCPPRRL